MSDFQPSSALIAFGIYCRRQSELDDLTDGELELWTQLADEIDSYLDTGNAPQPDLFGDAS